MPLHSGDRVLTTPTIAAYSKSMERNIAGDEYEVIQQIREVCQDGYGSVSVTVKSGRITTIRKERITQIRGGEPV